MVKSNSLATDRWKIYLLIKFLKKNIKKECHQDRQKEGIINKCWVLIP